jgi:predicted RNase H-like HicB family nuclease
MDIKKLMAFQDDDGSWIVQAPGNPRLAGRGKTRREAADCLKTALQHDSGSESLPKNPALPEGLHITYQKEMVQESAPQIAHKWWYPFF